jgi:hypothetical protein
MASLREKILNPAEMPFVWWLITSWGGGLGWAYVIIWCLYD